MSSEKTQEALDFIGEHNLKIFPADPDTKRPLVRGWQEKASKDPDQITQLFDLFDSPMIGVPTGPLNGISVLDIDHRPTGNGIWELEEKGITLPCTRASTTPSGGRHYYFRTGELEIPNSAGRIAPLVDFRGKGGYVIAPPSESSKGRYEWESVFCFKEASFQPISEYWLNLAMPQVVIMPKKQKSHLGFNKSRGRGWLLEPIIEGQRNNEMTRRAGYLLKKNNRSQAWYLFEKMNSLLCEPPLDFIELRQIFESIAKREGK